MLSLNITRYKSEILSYTSNFAFIILLYKVILLICLNFVLLQQVLLDKLQQAKVIIFCFIRILEKMPFFFQLTFFSAIQ